VGESGKVHPGRFAFQRSRRALNLGEGVEGGEKVEVLDYDVV